MKHKTQQIVNLALFIASVVTYGWLGYVNTQVAIQESLSFLSHIGQALILASWILLIKTNIPESNDTKHTQREVTKDNADSARR